MRNGAKTSLRDGRQNVKELKIDSSTVCRDRNRETAISGKGMSRRCAQNNKRGDALPRLEFAKD
ncbi:MAG: hypothetical protein DMG30_10945 [Acidobacteria bacterium]|nr:MAG: hypothetical protein DMG30_10945 [Acidobacteriota bacterium]